MEARRGFLKAAAALVLVPFRSLLADAKKSPVRRNLVAVTSQDQKMIRTFYEQGWNKGDMAVLRAHPKIAQECAQLHERFRRAFPDLTIQIDSMSRAGDAIDVRWTAQGTHRGPMGGLKATGRRASVDGVTRLKVVDGKIVSASAEWNEADLKSQLSGPGAS